MRQIRPIETLAKAYLPGNSMNGQVPADPWSLVTGVNPEGYRQAKPIDIAPITPEPAASAYARVLADAGASVSRDPVDLRIIEGNLPSLREQAARAGDTDRDRLLMELHRLEREQAVFLAKLQALGEVGH